MKSKIIYLLLFSALVCGGCSPALKDQSSVDTQEQITPDVQVVGETSIGSGTTYVIETEIQSELGPNDPYPIGHTLYDNSITFCDDVAVIMHDVIESYDPSSREVTISREADIGDCIYAYVYYSESPSDYFFQRITKKAVTEDGTTIITLSGVPLQSEMDNESFLQLIESIDAYGDTEGSNGDAFEIK